MAKGESGIQTQGAPTLLIVDDERSLRFSIGEWARDSGYRPLEAASGREARAMVREQALDVALLDVKLADEDGLQVLKGLREEDPILPVIMLTGHGTVEHAVRATRLGAWDFMLKPPDLERLGVVVAKALEHARMQRELEHLREGARLDQKILGESPGLKKVLHDLEKVARADHSTVLLRGETGSGKELMARHLHSHSARSNQPFVPLNCSAIPEHLLESQLFGHEKGAFTDAKHFKKGLFDLADGGMLFLDEIGEMPSQLQSKLLRVLETRSFRRVGGTSDITVDVRIIAATHRDLKRLVADGRFREDLYFRLNVVPVLMPPLRDRPEDIPVLATHFIKRLCDEWGRPVARLHPGALAAFMTYGWPGNVRELRNVLERVLILEAQDEILPDHLPVELSSRAGGTESTNGASPQPFPPGVVRPLVEIEKMAIEHALGVCGGNKTRAAEMLGISRQTLRTKLKDFRMPDDTEDSDS